MDVVTGMPRNGNAALLPEVLVLPMASLGLHQFPAILLNRLDDIPNFHPFENDSSASWKIENDSLCPIASGPRPDRSTPREFRNFGLQFDWRLAEGKSSGVK